MFHYKKKSTFKQNIGFCKKSRSGNLNTTIFFVVFIKYQSISLYSELSLFGCFGTDNAKCEHFSLFLHQYKCDIFEKNV